MSIFTIVGLEFHLGASFAARRGQTTGLQTNNTAAPHVDRADLMAVAR